MNKRLLHGLVALNVALLLALGWLTFAPDSAHAQFGGGAGDYVMVGGARNGVTPDTIYVTDLTSGVIIGFEPKSRGRNGELVATGFRVIANDFNALQGR